MRRRDTYRAARRNACIRELKGDWGPDWYYKKHRNAPRWAVERGLSPNHNGAIVIEGGSYKRKQRTSAMALLKRGDYAGALREFFGK